MTSGDDRPLPYGWIKQHDSKYDRDFWVDTKASPPRSIWVHPYEDERFLNEHPDVREKVRGAPPSYAAPAGPPPGSSSSSNPRESYQNSSGQNRSLFGKVKDSVVGTKEEREAAARAEEERRRRIAAAAPRQAQPQYGYGQPQGYGGYGGYGGPPPQGYYGGPPPQGYYGAPPPQSYYGAPQPQYVQAAPQRSSGFTGSSALPLIGGLAGGLLLGEAIDGFGGDGGDGGGDFGGDGGDF